jgi:hypothetical protein
MITQEIKGRWWEPSSPDTDVSGVLKISEHGDVDLDLNGTINSLKDFGGNEWLKGFAVLNGVTQDHRLVTLRGAMATGFHIGMPGYATQRFSIRQCLFGGLFQQGALKTKRARLYFRHLHAWAGGSGIHQEEDPERQGRRVSWIRPPVQTGTLKDGTSVSLRYGSRWTPAPDAITLSEDPFIEIAAAEDLPIDDFASSYIAPIRALLSIAFAASALPTRTVLVIENLDREAGTETVEVEMVRGLLHPPVEADFSPLFVLPRAPLGFAGLVEAWFPLHQRVEPVIDLLTGLLFDPPHLQEPRLLILAVAAEAYHRIAEQSAGASRAEDARWQRLLGVCPNDLKSWLAQHATMAAEPSLRVRLASLAKRARRSAAPMLTREKNYPWKLANWRNRFVHHDPSHLETMDGRQMRKLAEITRVVLEVCLLQDLGFEAAQVENVLHGHAPYIMVVSSAL